MSKIIVARIQKKLLPLDNRLGRIQRKRQVKKPTHPPVAFINRLIHYLNYRSLRRDNPLPKQAFQGGLGLSIFNNFHLIHVNMAGPEARDMHLFVRM